MRRTVPLALFAAVTVVPATWTELAFADKKGCIAASDAGQEARELRKLLAARAQFMACAAEECPGAVRGFCARKLEEVESILPSIVVRAKDGRGVDVTDVRVLVDGKLEAERLDGTAVSLDPGEHRIRLETAHGTAVEETLVARVGEKNRAVDVTLGAPVEAAPVPSAWAPSASRATPEARRPLVVVYVLGGTAAVALASFGYFAISGFNQLQDMRGTCRPFCAQSDIDSLHHKLLVADISLSVAVVALAAGAVALLTQTTHPRGSGDR
jgi:hypothetical protein